MAYAGVDKRRLAQLLEWGADDDELRRFFLDSRVQLIRKGGRVQNLPHGKAARIRVLAHELPPSTDKVVQEWFAEKLTMVDPEPATVAVESLRMYEDVGESIPENEARKLARSCLVHLFAEETPQALLEYLKPAKKQSPNQTAAKEDDQPAPTVQQTAERPSGALASALIALTEGKDPDEHLPSLPPVVATLVAGIHAVRAGSHEEVKASLDALADEPALQQSLADYATRSSAASAAGPTTSRGLQVVSPLEATETAGFDLDRDEVLATCTKDFPENAVFVRPLAIRTSRGAWFSLAKSGPREKLFYTSGDVIVFPGRDRPRQPRRGEIGIWRVAENENTSPSYRTNFHVVSEKTSVYEVCEVPFASTDYDSVREYIKHQAEQSDAARSRTTLFLLRDGLIVGWPPGKDLTKDEAFETGLPSWTALPAIRSEGRLIVPGPLPNDDDTYECETLASSLRKLLTSDKSAAPKLTKAQLKTIQEVIASGEARLDAVRARRLRAELSAIEEHEGATEVLLQAVMAQRQIASLVKDRVQEKVDALLAEKEELRKAIEDLKRDKSNLAEERRRLEREQRAIAPAVAKAIKAAFDKARREAVETLGQVVVFKTLIDEAIERPTTAPESEPTAGDHPPASLVAVRQPRGNIASSVPEILHSLGVTPKYAQALHVVGRLAQSCGLILVVEGLAARLAVEGWVVGMQGQSKVLECRIGLIDDSCVRGLLAEPLSGIAILDANLSPLDVYAAPLMDAVQQRVAGLGGLAMDTLVVMSLTSGVAALPLPAVMESIALRVTMDRLPEFLTEADAAQRLEEITAGDEPIEWTARLWRPALARLLGQLQSLAPEDAALVLSVLSDDRKRR